MDQVQAKPTYGIQGGEDYTRALVRATAVKEKFSAVLEEMNSAFVEVNSAGKNFSSVITYPDGTEVVTPLGMELHMNIEITAASGADGLTKNLNTYDFS